MVVMKTKEKVLAYIKEYTKRIGYPPTLQEIADGCGIGSKSTVSYYLNQLQGEGAIHRRRGVPRSITVTVIA